MGCLDSVAGSELCIQAVVPPPVHKLLGTDPCFYSVGERKGVGRAQHLQHARYEAAAQTRLGAHVCGVDTAPVALSPLRRPRAQKLRPDQPEQTKESEKWLEWG